MRALVGLQHELEKLPDILKAFPPQRIAIMQSRLADVWQRFLYSSAPLFPKAVDGLRSFHTHVLNESLTAPDESLPASVHSPVGQNDAFATILQWLYHRMEDVHQYEY